MQLPVAGIAADRTDDGDDAITALADVVLDADVVLGTPWGAKNAGRGGGGASLRRN